MKKGKVITLNIHKGGTGKSTTAINLAITAAHHGLKVAVIDGDDNQTTYSQFALRNNVNEANREAGKPLLPFVKCEKYEPKENIRPIVEQLKADFDLVIIDTAGGKSELFRSIIQISDRIIIPTKTNMIDMRQIAPTVTFIRGIEDNVRLVPGWENFSFDVRVLFNSVNKRSKAYSDSIKIISGLRSTMNFISTVVPHIEHLQRFDFNDNGFGLSDIRHPKRAVYELILREILE